MAVLVELALAPARDAPVVLVVEERELLGALEAGVRLLVEIGRLLGALLHPGVLFLLFLLRFREG